MRFIKYTHSCVRIARSDGGVLVIAPGVWSEPRHSTAPTQFNERGISGIDDWLREQSGVHYRWLAPGQTG